MTHLSPCQFKAVAHELAPGIPPEVAAYLQHIVNNKLHIVLGNIELAAAQVADGEHLENAVKAGRELREEIMQLTAPALEKVAA